MRVKKLINAPAIIGYSSVVGKREYEGPLASDFDLHDSGKKPKAKCRELH